MSGRRLGLRVKHCPVTGRPVLACDCGACDELDEYDGGDEEDDG